MKNPILLIIKLLIITLLLIEISCTPKVKPDPQPDTDPVVTTSCIDRSKIDKNRGCPRNYESRLWL